MALIARYLVDTSAAARMKSPAVARRLAPLIEAGLVATTAQLDAEALYSARNPAEYEQLWSDRRLAYEYLPTADEHWQAALGAQRTLARDGRHRAVGMADLLIATLAVAHDVTLIHYDSDFDIAADALPLQHHWVVDRGSVD
ncbi:PIN domain-containing protein [Mycolicibacterium sp. CBMA 226]|uniref:PIN domain-containing protein n=1 Tax=Mycolicibacterium sp. CBMA 226 TaxID=2606611 RepID=UPI001306C2BC|nr:PIN domain-containing protein [Mycolicibacterium sp. CBMA 226]MUL78842.1 PIN domain nuclease [Mycolicibacterium sp. CBMA 226]QGW61139.1 Ribonuclease VapC21 [Mycolicibacterium sp.]